MTYRRKSTARESAEVGQ